MYIFLNIPAIETGSCAISWWTRSACEKKTCCDSVFSSGNGLRYSAFLAQYRVSIDFSVNVQLRRSRGTLFCRYEFVKRAGKQVPARVAGLPRGRREGRYMTGYYCLTIHCNTCSGLLRDGQMSRRALNVCSSSDQNRRHS